MNQQLQVFNHEQFGDVRIIEEDGRVLFCGKDVAKALGYENPRDAIRRHCRGVVKRDGVSKTTNQHPMLWPPSQVAAHFDLEGGQA